jgi:hypothetical protein
MSDKSLMVVGQTNRFERQATQIARPNPASPLVLQKFMQLLANLNNKVDALAARPPQIVQVKPVESKQVEVKPPAAKPEKKVDRKKLRDIFD